MFEQCLGCSMENGRAINQQIRCMPYLESSCRVVLDRITYLARNSGITILLVEQSATRALQIGHTAYLLVNGTTIFHGTTKALLEHQELGKLYLGLTSFSAR